MSLDSAIRRFRRKQAEQFTQRATIRRPVGERTYDPVTREDTQRVVTMYSDWPCKTSISTEMARGRDLQAGETEVRVADLDIKFPIETDVAVNDLVELIDATYHPLIIGKQFRITDIDEREWQISRRCIIEETIVPRLWEELDEES